MVGAIGITAGLAPAQDAPTPPVTQNGPSTAASAGLFLLGGATAFAAHEGGHLLFDAIFDAHPRLEKVSFNGIPFFAITHDSGLSDRQEYVIDTAGFWVQEGTNEWLLHKHPDRFQSYELTCGRGRAIKTTFAAQGSAGITLARLWRA